MTKTLLQPIVQRRLLKNGMVAIAVENAAADIVAARIFVRAGSRCEPLAMAGLSHILAAVLTKGTEQLSSFEIAEKIESVGASLSTNSSPDYFLMSLKTVSADFPEILKLANELLRSPSFPEPEVELEKRLTLQGIRSQKEQPFSVAFEQLREAMYPGHPYGFSALGTEKTIEKITRTDIQNYHQTYFHPDNIVISIAGRINPEMAIKLVEEIFGDWQVSPERFPQLNLPKITPNPCHLSTAQDSQQSIVMLGYLAPAVTYHHDDVNDNSLDYAALKLLNTYLGNGLSSRLFVELREKRGLAYDVSAFYPTRLDPAMFVVYMGTAPENTLLALESLRNEVQRLCEIPLTAEELQASKNKLLGQYALGKQTNAQLAQIFGWYETIGLGIEFDTRFPEAVSSVNAAIAQSAAGKYLAVNPYVSLVGPAEALKGIE